MTITHILATALVGVLAATTTQAQTVDTPIGKLEFEQGVPKQATVKNLYDEMDFQRACQFYLWAFPVVTFLIWRSIWKAPPALSPVTSPSTWATNRVSS